MKQQLSIAVVGGGVAGITAAYLLQQKHDVTLFEKNGYIGGHTNTVTIPSGPDRGLPVDTGFIVMNDRTYPLFSSFLDRLGVETSETDMSFSYYCRSTGIQYGSSGLNSLMAQRKNLLNPGYWRFLAEILRFFRTVRESLNDQSLVGLTLDDFVRREGFSRRLYNHYLLPMSAAIWSASDRDMKGFPMESFARFYENHGLLSARDHPQWYFISGGSQSYVRAFLKSFSGKVLPGMPAESIRRHESGVSITVKEGESRKFDAVVIATHADEALQLLEDPSEKEQSLLSPWKYSSNQVILHRDTSLLPPNPRARSSWNTIREEGHSTESPITVTYDMNRLQKLPGRHTYCVTLNTALPINEDQIIKSIAYTHPIFSFPAMDTQSGLHELNGQRNTWFCGSYFGYGFHEDAVRSSVEVGRRFGVEL